ncbi:MAG: protein kinase domain-containing protein [Blastocatellia bacterium]
MMTPERWQLVQQVFNSALEHAPEDREAFLDEACAGQPSLRVAVESLIAVNEEASGFLETPMLKDLAERVVAGRDANSMAGRRLGPYQLVRELGRGGMGAVYLAERADDQFSKQVAIKIINGGARSEELRRRFLGERQILAGLEHPNIARLLDGGTSEDGDPYLVMEYVEGLPIDEYCRQRDLSVDEKLRLFLLVCDAAQHAHQNLIVHRDLKPSNIIVTSDGAPKLLDFGIAKLLQPGRDKLTTGLRPMTPAYASPEQMFGEPITTSSDVYSLGVVLYELLASERPYDPANDSPAEMVKAICEQEPERPGAKLERSGNAPLDRDLDDIVLMALRKEPSRRYGSVRELAEDIGRYLEGLPVRARHATFGYRAEKFVRRNKAAVTAAMTIFLLLVGGIITTSWQAGVAHAQRVRAEAALAEAESAKARADAERQRAEAALAKAEEQRVRAEGERSRAEAASAKAVVERERAESEKARAERRFNDVRKLANFFLFKLHDAIKPLAGSTQARQLMVKEALEYLDSLAREAGDNRSLQRELAAAYDKVGDVQGNSYYGDFGDPAAALQSFRQALAIRQALARDDADAQARRDLAASHRKIGEALEAARRTAEALASYRQALAIYEDLPATPARQEQARRELMFFHGKISFLRQLSGDRDESREHSEKMQAILATLVTRQSRDGAPPESQRGMDHQLLGEQRRQSGDLAGARESYQKRLAMAEDALAKNPFDAMARRGLAGSHTDLGDLLAQSGDTAGALARYRRALAIFEELSAQDPANARDRRYVSETHRNVGMMLKRLGDLAGALESYRQALAIDEALAAQNPAYAPTLSHLAASHMNLADILALNGDPSGAVRRFQQALALRESIAAQDPTNVLIRLNLADTHSDLADILRRNGKVAEALEHYRQSLALAKTVAAKDPLETKARNAMSEYHYRIGECLAKLDDADGALNHYQQSVALRESLAAANPASVDTRLSPTFAYTKLSELYATLASQEAAQREQRLEHWRAARAWRQKSLAIFLDLRERGLLPGKHATKPDETAREIARCEEEITKLQGGAAPDKR